MGRGLSFPYKYIDGRYRPFIPIKLEGPRDSIQLEVLVDSGADICMVDADLGRAIGLTIEEGEPFELGGVTGTTQMGYIHTVTITVGRSSFRTKAGFMDNMRDGSYGMVGQKGFFDRFAIKFDYAEKKIVLHKKKWA